MRLDGGVVSVIRAWIRDVVRFHLGFVPPLWHPLLHSMGTKARHALRAVAG